MVIAIADPEITRMIFLIVVIYPRGRNTDEVIVAFRVKADIAMPPFDIAAQPLPSLATTALSAVPFSGVVYPNNQSVTNGKNHQAHSERQSQSKHINHINAFLPPTRSRDCLDSPLGCIIGMDQTAGI